MPRYRIRRDSHLHRRGAQTNACAPLLHLFLLAALLLFWQPAAFAQNAQPQEKRSKLESLKQMLGLKRSEYKEIQGQERQLVAELERLEQQLKTYQDQLDEQKTRLAAHQEKLADIERSLAAMESSQKQKKAAMAKRLRAIYKMGDLGYLTPLLAVSSDADVQQHIKYLQVISEGDRQLLNETAAAMNAIRDEQAKLEAQREEVLAVQKTMAEQHKQIRAQQQEKETLLAKISTDKEQYAALIQRLESSAGELQTFLTDLDLQRAAEAKKATPTPPKAGAEIVFPENPQSVTESYAAHFRANKGKLLWPVEGKIITEFGPLRIGDTYTTSNGVDIQAPRGTPFYAVFKGTVMFAGWFKNYGKIVIVDHGGNFLSLYAHADEIGVKIGQKIETRQQLGKVGDTGSMKGASLHFEVRVNGTPENPKQWLAKVR